MASTKLPSNVSRAPDKIHTLAIDYRGFGSSTGSPSEEGLLNDAVALAEWAVDVAGIPPSRIVVVRAVPRDRCDGLSDSAHGRTTASLFYFPESS